MSDEMLVQNGSPTLAGIKTGNLFTCPYTDRRQTMHELQQLNKRLVPKGLRILPLRYSAERVLVYLYRPSRLEKDLSEKEAVELLENAGYRHENANQCVIELIRRINDVDTEFPHEIGLFLSYPPEKTGQSAASWWEPGAFTVMFRKPERLLRNTGNAPKITADSGPAEYRCQGSLLPCKTSWSGTS